MKHWDRETLSTLLLILRDWCWDLLELQDWEPVVLPTKCLKQPTYYELPGWMFVATKKLLYNVVPLQETEKIPSLTLIGQHKNKDRHGHLNNVRQSKRNKRLNISTPLQVLGTFS